MVYNGPAYNRYGNYMKLSFKILIRLIDLHCYSNLV